MEHQPSSDETIVHEKLEKSNTLSDASDIQNFQPASETPSEDSAATEDDVKVCDICGDAGLEELLAICTRCSDGAEHTYCMREMLENLPEGDWICEECKNNEKTKVDEENGTSNEEKRHESNVTLTSVATGKAFEVSGGSVGTGGKTAYSCGSSFNDLDMAKSNPLKLAPSHGGPLSKSVSFNKSSVKPKIKELTGDLPQKLFKSYASSNTRKLEVTKEITKSASIKDVNSTNVLGISKIESVPRRAGDMRKMQEAKAKHIIEKKKASTVVHPLISPRPVNATGVPLPKPDLKVPGTSKLNIHGVNSSNDSNSSGPNVVESACISKSFRSSTSNGIFNSEDQKPCQVISNNDLHANIMSPDGSCSNSDKVSLESAPLDSVQRDGQIKTTSFLTSSKQSVLVGNRISRCQRCNEAGHTTQNCSIDKLRMTALKPSVDRNLKLHIDRSKKWKEAVEAAMKKPTIHKKHQLATQNGDLLMSNTDISCHVGPKSSHSTFGAIKNLSSLVADDEKNLRPVDSSKRLDIEDKSQSAWHDGCLSAPSASESNPALTLSDKSNVKPLMQSFPDGPHVLANLLKAVAFPELDFIWQGSFEVLRTGRHPELCEGLQAHLSSSVSSEVLKVAAKFPCRVQVDEVLRSSSWPLQFHKNRAKDENIALFFFAKDLDSYEKTYRNLLENMIQNDLALKGDINGDELLIFPSNHLAENSQRWNSLFFLWGVFRKRRDNCAGSLEGLLEKPIGSTSSEPLRAPLISGAPTSDKINRTDNQDTEISKGNAADGTRCVDSQSVSSSGIKDTMTCNIDSEVRKDVATEGHESTSNFEQAISGKDKVRQMEEKIVKDNDELGVREMDSESWEFGIDRKRIPSFTNRLSLASSGSLKSTSETLQENNICESVGLGKETKRLKLESGGYASCSSIGSSDVNSSRVKLSSDSCLDSGGDGTVLYDSSRTNERNHIPVDLNLAKDSEPDNIVYVLSSDDEDLPNSHIPDLDLALGGEKKPQSEESLQQFPSMSGRRNQTKQSGTPATDHDGGSASLSLSLAFPGSK